ncbi:Adenylate kinase 2 [Sporothrix eucalyptigena]|uniref:GTP:AMP phosphotransferase, mitochondrial n=1 Tax=Sporothrix eucalyptigena TaxID=1812306 RepID=A0ABP0BQL4_9PEZI
MRMRKAARVILIGAPGVGKGTQSERLLGRFPQLAHLSSGDLLRHNVKTRTPLGIKVESTIKAGGLVPDDLILRLIRNELSTRGWLRNDPPQIMTLASAGLSSSGSGSHPNAEAEAGVPSFLSETSSSSSSSSLSNDPSASFLLDGFPRTAGQAAQLDTIVPINLVVSLKTPFSVMLARINGRWVHEPSGRVYNESFNAPKVPGRDDVTGEPLVRRADDSEEVYRARFNKFEETSAPLLDHYARQGVLWEVEGMSSDEITPKLVAEFERRFCGAEA